MTEDERIAQLVASVRDDPRVLGVARTKRPLRDAPHLLIVTTWDGGESLPRELPRLCAPLVGDGPRIEQSRTTLLFDPRIVVAWVGIGVDGTRANVIVRRAGDLVPSGEGRFAVALHDPRGILENWIRCCRDASPQDWAERAIEMTPVETMIWADERLRHITAASAYPDGSSDECEVLRSALHVASKDDPAQAALVQRIDAALRETPGAERGTRVLAHDDATAAFERFLATADAEGFKGDRVLFTAAVDHLRAFSKREPVFHQGFLVPTFDAVEAGFALGEAVGGCKPPLIPGVYVGVGVTPKDALDFWAAPFVRDPTCSVACIDDTGDRDVVERAAGRDPMLATLTSVIDAAYERLPALLESARQSATESVDPTAVLKTLHLPATFVERAKRRGAGALMCSRLTVALAVARAGHDCAPLAARKFGLAAGRVLSLR